MMLPLRRAGARMALDVPTILFIVLAIVLLIAGGASRSDAIGQVAVRTTAWGCLIASILLCEGRPFQRGRAVAVFFAASVTLVIIQLVPLPPDIWTALPGRDAFAEAGTLSGDPGAWRPLAITPSAAINAFSSLVVPLAVLCLITSRPFVSDGTLVRVLLTLVLAEVVIGLLQFVGSGFESRFVKSGLEASGTFANRNHFALMAGFGFVLLPAWTFLDDRNTASRGLIAIGLSLLMALAIVASGSRAGTVLGAISLVCGLLLSRKPMRGMLAKYPRWLGPVLIGGIVVAVIGLILLSVSADRAVSIDRALQVDVGQDMRGRSFATVLTMVQTHIPFGTGIGGFDALFRFYEPDALLKPTYFNRAHNDFLEVALDAGVPGIVLMVITTLWWAWRSIVAWLGDSQHSTTITARLGSALLLLILLASAVDYPARTPIIMAVVMVAATLLAGPGAGSDADA